MHAKATLSLRVNLAKVLHYFFQKYPHVLKMSIILCETLGSNGLTNDRFRALRKSRLCLTYNSATQGQHQIIGGTGIQQLIPSLVKSIVLFISKFIQMLLPQK